MIAFGAGRLVSSLLPASRVEQQAAQRVRDTAQPVVDDLTDTAKEVRGPERTSQQAIEEVLSIAADAVKSQAKDSRNTLQQTAP